MGGEAFVSGNFFAAFGGEGGGLSFVSGMLVHYTIQYILCIKILL